MSESQEQSTDTNKEQSTDSWHSSLSENLRSNEALTRFKDIDGLANSYLQMEKSYNNRVSVPDDKTSDADKNKFFERLGRPTDKKYLTENRNKDDEEILSRYEELFYNNGVSKKQGEAILNKMYELQKTSKSSHEEQTKQRLDGNLKFLNDTYGDKFESNVTLARGALDKYGSLELAKMLEESQYHPAIVDFLVKVGANLNPKPLITGANSNSSNSSTPELALKEIKKLESSSDFMLQLKDKKHVGHSDSVKKMNELYATAYSK